MGREPKSLFRLGSSEPRAAWELVEDAKSQAPAQTRGIRHCRGGALEPAIGQARQVKVTPHVWQGLKVAEKEAKAEEQWSRAGGPVVHILPSALLLLPALGRGRG